MSEPSRPSGQPAAPTAADLDRARRVENAFLIGIGLGLLNLVQLAAFFSIAPDRIAVVSMLSVAGSRFLLAALARRGWLLVAAWGLVITNAGAMIAVAATLGDVSLAPMSLGLGVLIATATLSPASIVIAAAVQGGALLLIYKIFGALGRGVPAWVVAANAGMLLVAGALVGVLQAISARRAVHMAVEGSERARAAEQARRESEEKYRLIADNTTDLVVLSSPDEAILYASPAVARLLGRTPTRVLGSDGTALLPRKGQQGARHEWRTVLEVGDARGTFPVTTVAGVTKWMDVVLTRVADAAGAMVLITARDITAQRDLSAQLQQSQKMDSLGRLAGGIAHDFNNLLLIVKAGAELTQRAMSPDSVQRRNIDAILDATDRAATLTRQLLAFSRRQLVVPERMDVVSVIRDLGALLERALGKRCALKIVLPEDAIYIIAGPSHVEQIVMNLAINARDAMPEGGTLTLLVRPAVGTTSVGGAFTQCVELLVSDTGCGMSEEVRARCFEPFFTTKAEDTGTGLGLSTCFGIANQLGGSIDVDSQPGAGTTFRVMLPQAREDTAIRRRSLLSLPGKATPPRLEVLVVDDDPGVLEVTGQMLRGLGHSVMSAAGVEPALRLVREHRGKLDLVITDVVLGSASGTLVIDGVRALRRETTLIVMSGYADKPEGVSPYLEQGLELLPKPFGERDLALAIERALANRETGG